MIDIKNIKLMDYSYKGNMLITINLKPSEFEHLKQQLHQDHELRKRIVDLADIWDGKESEIYGKQLLKVLNDLGIKDIPEFYSKI